MAKSSSRKSLKSLFSRSEANLSVSTAKDVDKNEREKKKFKFFRIKKKSSSGPASEKPANEGQQVLYRAGDSTKANGETSTANNTNDQKKTFLYATAPRSKAKELSYSETDLSKPKRFATFAFGLRKKKTKDGDILSKSAFGLQSTGIEEQEEPPPDLGKMDLDQTIGKRFSLSQPELDTSSTFDIPSPPPVATNQSDSHFPLPEASKPPDSANTQLEAKAPLINGSSFLEVHAEPLKAPIATIPELQLEGPDLLDLAKNDANSPALMTQTDTTSEQPVLSPPLEPNTADLKAAVVDPVSSSNGPSDSESHQHIKPETSPNQPDTPDITDGVALNDKPSMASVDPKICGTDITGHQDVSISHTERGLPETNKSGTTAEKITTPADHTEVYGALYESLFPQSFTSEVMSSLLSHPPQAHTEIQCHTERTIVYSSLSSSESNKDNVADNYQTSTTSELLKDQATLNSITKNTVPYSELTSSFSEVKSDSPDLIQSTVKPAPVAQSPAPPVSDYAASQGTDTQVTDPKRRVILVRELVTDEASSASGRSSPGLEKMDSGNDLVSNTDTAKTFSDVPHRKLSLYDGALSPTYFSVGSDDGSAVDIYYSAEEDNIHDSGDEEIYKVNEKEEKRIADMAREVTRALEEQSQQREMAETEINKKDEGGARVVIVKMQSEENNDDGNSQAEVYHQSSETFAAGLPEGNIVKTNEKEVATAVIPDVTEESKEIRLSEDISETKTDENGLRVVIAKMQNEDCNDELSRSDIQQQSSDTFSAKILDEDEAITASSRVNREVEEVTVLREEPLRQEKIAEEEPSLADEGGKRVVIVKMLSEEGDDSNDLKSQEKEVATEVVELREYIGDISKQGELPEKVSNQTEENGPRVVIVKMRSVESNEEVVGDSICQTEVQQQSEISEDKVAKILVDQVEFVEVAQELEEVTELREFLHDISKKEELPEGVTSPPDEGGHRVVIVKMQSEESTEEETGDTRNQTVVQISETLKTEIPESNVTKIQEDEVEAAGFSEAAEEVTKEVTELREYIGDISKKGELPEGMTSSADEVGHRVVIVKMQSQESTEEDKEDTIYQTEVQQQPIETELSQAEVSPKVTDEVTEVAELLDDNSKEGQIVEEEISKGDEDGTSVVCVKMNSDEKMKDISSRAEELHQMKDRNSVCNTYQTLEGITAESEDANQPVFVNVEEEIKELKEVLPEEFAKQGERQISTEDKKEEMKEGEGNQTELQQTLKIQVSETLVLDSKILGEEVTTEALPGVNIEITEKETITKDVDSKKEKEEEIRHQNEVQELLRLQNLETLTLGVNQEDKPAIFTSPEVAEEVKENEGIAVNEIGEVEMSSETETSEGLESNNDKILETKKTTSIFQEVSEGVKVAVELLGEVEEQEISKKDQEGEAEKMEQLSMSGMHEAKTLEKDAVPTALSEVAEEKTQVTCLLEDSKIVKDGEVKSLEKAAKINADPGVAEEGRDVIKLCENFSTNEEIAEKQTLLKDEEDKKQKEEGNKHKIEVQQLRGQSSRPLTSRFLEVCDMYPQEREIATAAYVQVKEEGEEERKAEFLAAPVGQVKTLMVCEFAPPSSELRGLEEGSKGNQAKELVIEVHPKEAQQLPRQEAQYVAHKGIRSPEYIYAASSNSSRVEERITPLFREAEKQVSLLAETNKRVNVSTETNSSTASAVTDTLTVVQVVTSSTERQSDATEIEHNRAAQGKTEWADTITQSTDRTSTVKEQVAVELSTTIEDAHLPDTKAAGASSKTQEPADSNPDLNEGSPTVSKVLTVTTEILTAENPPNQVDQELEDEMMSGYSSLSTKLSFKTSSPPKEDETRYRVHKLSLTSESDSKESSKDAVDSVISNSTVSESNGSDVDPEYRWKNRFEGVSQFIPSKIEEFSSSDSLSHTDNYSSPSSLSSLSSTSTLPEATTYKHVSNASFSSTFPSSEDQITLSSRLSDRSEVFLSRESQPAAGESTDERRRGLVEREEPAAPAGEREREREAERFKTSWESHLSSVSSHDGANQAENTDTDSTLFTGVFKATLVELVSDPTAPPPPTPPASPDIDSLNQFDMDNLVDTLKNMGPTMRPRGMGVIRPPAPVLHSSLPPIKEDAASPISIDVRDSISSPLKKMEALNKPAEPLNGLYTLPADIGLKRSAVRDSRSPLELMKQNQQEQLINSPLRASATNSIVMRKNSDPSVEDLHSPLLNGNGQSPGTASRLDNSVLFGSYRSGSIDQKQENKQVHRQLFRTTSLPESGLPNDHTKDFSNLSTGSSSMDQTGSRLDRFAFLLNSPSSPVSLTGAEDLNMRMSRPPALGIGSPTSSNSPNRLLSPTGSINLDHSVSMFGQNQGIGMTSPPLLQRSFSSEGITGIQQTPMINGSFGGSQIQSLEQERNLASKYRAFPDAYLTKEKEHGKLNPRPGKIYIFDQPGMCGQRIEVGSDVMDATSWELQETISIRVVRGGWVLYEKPNYKGEKIALDEGDIELTYPFISPEEELQNGQQPQNGQQEEQKQNGDTSEVQTENKPVRRFIIGSLRRAVRDYSVPEISLFPEENAEGKKVIFRDTSEDARIFGFPIKANSIIINAGLWLVYAHPFFQGVPRVLEVGGYTNPAAWGVEKPYVGSLHPLKVGEPRVENLSEPRIVIYDKPYFTGKSRTVTTNSRDFMTRVDRQQTAFMYSVGSMKVLGGIWVGYEKEGYRGHQYLLEEGEYQDWRVWGGCDAELRSVRVIRADLTEPLMVMFEQQEDQEGMQEENTFEVTEAIPDVELFEYKTSTRSIHVLSGAWVAYSHVDFSGNQYILEKGFYNNCADWGSQDNRICSVQPILLAPSDITRGRNEIILYSEPDFQGQCHVFDRNQEALPERFLIKSCRVSGGSWVLYEEKKFSGNLYVLSEGDYPNLTSMGCLPSSYIRSVKVVPLTFSVPSISLFGLECLEGREITTDTEIISMVEEGFNNHILSVRVNSGCWVICEHSNYRGRQFLLEPIEITNWHKFSSLQTIGSMYPVRQRRHLFRIKNKERGHFLSIQGGVEEMKSGRVVVTPEVEGLSDIWFYQDGFIKSKVSPTMSLQVIGNIEQGAKVVLWSETRQPIQTWTAKLRGMITSLTFPGMVLDVKGGKNYDKDHVVIMPENEERPSQHWEIDLL